MSVPTPYRRLLIDVTDTLAQDFRTGIQRVVRQVAGRLKNLEGFNGWEVVPVAAIDGTFHRVLPAGLTRLQGAERAASHLPGNRWKTMLLRALEIAPPALDAVQRWNFNRRSRKQLEPYIVGKAITPKPPDIVLLLDTYWGGTSSIVAARRSRDAGATVIPVVYDLIPITHPKYTLPLLALTFKPRLLQALRIATGVIAISNTCAGEVKAFAERQDLPLPVEVFRLGSDLRTMMQRIAPSTTDGPFHYVMVGSIEPHKNHATVLATVDALWREGWAGTLTIVGRIGRVNPDLVDRLQTHPERGGRLRLVHDASDRQLGEILRASDAMIMASRAEGFGLPIVEALSNGLPVLASDIPVFQEIGGEAILTFALDDPSALRRAIAQFETDPEHWRRAAVDYRWLTWDESTRELLQAVNAIVSRASTD